VEVASGAGVCVIVESDTGANSLFATGCPTTPITVANEASAADVISHCQPVTMRARRVR